MDSSDKISSVLHSFNEFPVKLEDFLVELFSQVPMGHIAKWLIKLKNEKKVSDKLFVRLFSHINIVTLASAVEPWRTIEDLIHELGELKVKKSVMYEEDFKMLL